MTSGTHISDEIWDLKYRLKGEGGRPLDATQEDTFRRVAAAAARAEKKRRRHWETEFLAAIADKGFLPAGRILAGAGSGRQVTLFNCFVMGRIDDDLGAIFDGVKEAALTMQQGGGVGMDFSTLRPKGAPVVSIGADASGPLSFMDVWDAMCRTIMSAGARRGAMMATLRCDHPDIEAFIDAKADAARLRNFNLSVLVTDAFVSAVRADGPWDLVFGGKVWRTLPARQLWDRLMRATYDYAEPGVIFIDRVNAENNLGYCEEIHATNPCGEQPLPPYGACLLGSINLMRFVVEPFTPRARLDLEAVERRVGIAVRFLDDVIDVSGYPLPEQRHEARAKRRIGLGVTALADALAALGVRYGSPEAVRLTGEWLAAVERAAYLASAALAAEKGAFPLFDADAFLARPNVRRLDPDVRDAIARQGIRNGCLTSIAPTGTISLFAGNVSSGIEPIFDFEAERRVLGRDGSSRVMRIEDHAVVLWRAAAGRDAPLPAAFVRAGDLTPREHLEMQAAAQRHVDSSISKTINCPEDLAFEAFKSVYLEAYDLGLKGCTTYRPNPITGAVLIPAAVPGQAGQNPPEAVAPPGGAGSETGSTTRPSGLPAMPPARAEVVYMSRPLERDPALAGYTYKIKWPDSEHALYVTINDIERDGRWRPFEIFINTKNLEHYAWTVALTRMISAVFRRGGDVSFVAEELKAVFDPQGGRWLGGRYVPSLLAAIGEVIEGHFRRIGLAAPDEAGAHASDRLRRLSAEAAGAEDVEGRSMAGTAPVDRAGNDAASTGRAASGDPATAYGRHCPRCSSREFVRQEGCWVCRSCGFSRCG